MLKQPVKTITLRVVFVLNLFALFLISACSSVPSESDGRKFFEAKGAERNIFKVRNFTKTNGLGDEQRYSVEYEAELECLKPSAEPGVLQIAQPGFSVDCGSAGQIIKKKGTLVFVKTEQGWLVSPGASQ